MAVVLLGMLRNKALAALLGPTGVGLVGLLGSLMATGSAVASLGLGQAGIRQIAEAAATASDENLARVRRALSIATWTLAFSSGMAVAVYGHVIAKWTIGRPDLGFDVSWLGLGIGSSVCASGQTAVLNGMRRISELSILSVLTAAASTAIGIVAIWIWKDSGLLVFLLAAPVMGFTFGSFFLSRIPIPATASMLPRQLLPEIAGMARIGVSFMLAGVVGTGAQLIVRMLVQSELGLAGLGLFQAAWTISMTYIGFVLSALSTDFLPRLSAAGRDPALVNRLVNEQSEIALLLAAPVFLAMLALAPWVMSALYSHEFSSAASLLRWQILGDVLKLASWPIGFIIVAAGDGRSFLIAESSGMTVFVLVAFIGMPSLGLDATGLGFVAMYAFLLPLVYWRARKQTSFRWSDAVRKQFVVLLLAVLAVAIASARHAVLGLTLGLAACLMSTIHTVGRFSEMTELQGLAGRFGAFCRRFSGSRKH